MSASLRDLSATDLKRLGGLREQCSAPLACSEHGAPHPCELCELEGLLALSCTACGHQFTQGLSSLAERPCASGAEFASTGRIAFETEAVATLAEEQAEKERDRERERKRRQREENEARARQEAQALRERRLAERTARETRARAEADRRRELERAEAARLAEEERARAEAESRRESAERSLREAEAVAESRSQIAVLGSAVAALIGAVMAWRLPLLPLASTSWLNLILVYAPVVLVAWAIGAAPLYGKEVAHRSLSWWSALPWAIFCFAWPALIGLGACYLVSEISAAGAYFKALFYVSLFAFIGVTTMSCGGVAFSMEKPWPSAGVQPDFKGKRSWWLWLGVILTLSLNTALWQGQTLPLPGADDTYKVSNPVTPPIPVTLPPSAAVNTPPMPAAQAPAEKGFFGWVKGLFGGGTPAAPAAGPLLPLLGSPSSSSSRSQASGICIGKPNPAECVRSQLNRSGKLSPDDLRAAASQSLGQVATAVNAIDDLGKTQSQSILPAADVAIKMINELPKPQRGDRPTARALLTQGLNMFNQNGNAAEAVEILKRAHQTDPLDVQIVNDLAYVQMKNGQLDEAEDNLLATLMLAPKRTSAWANLAQLRTTSAPTDERAIEEAARYMVVAYWFSNDRVKTLNFINQQIKSGNGSTPFAVACKKALAKIGAESQVQGLSLADLEREEFTRKEWVVWQGRMKTDFEKTLAFKGSADLIVKAWEKFLVVWSLDNPLSREDESLRAEAIANKSKAQRIMLATQQPAATAPTPTRTAAGVNVNQCEKPEYPSASRRFEEEGTVALRFLVGVDGKVIQSEVEKSSGFKRLDEAARAGLSKCQFNPTLVDGKPEQAWASMKYTWRLE